MRRLLIPILLAFLLLFAGFGLIQIARGQGIPGIPQVLLSESQGENLRQVTAPEGVESPQSPDIGFIDSPTAGCYKPDMTQNNCYINWYYMSVSAAPNYVITMTATINAYGPVAHFQGFFQQSFYVPYNMNGDGFKVPCGALGAGGNPRLGNAYGYTIRARDSAGLSAANYGTVYCPAHTP